ncbi:hypothetical protein HAX54_040945 [Datura stramonium]|uniref:Protein kinase domain-containing protein n=1 Tax=Datura stramonium TaxID=4076 RepID=A0ABS8VQA2_DATST|nr:hypothetical protein [Datura stramonium]
MGCSFSGLNGHKTPLMVGGDVWINENRFKIIWQLGEGGFAYVFLVKEVLSDPSNPGVSKKFKHPSHISDDGTYAMKKVLIQNNEHLEMVREEIHFSSLFSHPNLLPLLDQAIISVQVSQDQSWKHEAYLLFPVHLDGTLLDNTKVMNAKKEFFSTSDVLQIFLQVAVSYVASRLSNNFMFDVNKICGPTHLNLGISCIFDMHPVWVSPLSMHSGIWWSMQLAIVNAQIKWPAGPNTPYPEALHQFVTWILQPQATVRPRIDDILIHIDKLISKFSN